MRKKKNLKNQADDALNIAGISSNEAATELNLEALEDAIDSTGNAIAGLSLEEVNTRISEGKINGDQNVRTKTVGQILKTNIFTFFNMLFVAIALILLFFIPQNSSGYMQFGFMLLVVFNTIIGLVQELKAKKTIDKLSLISAPKVIAIRGGKKVEIALSEIVIDEIVCLSSGDQICADAELIDGAIEVNESQITGEPDAIQKKVGDSVMSGSYVISGKAITKVVHIGKDNYATKISSGAKYLKKPSSEILRSLNAIIKFMAIVIIPLGIALFCMKYFAQEFNVDPEIIESYTKNPNIFRWINGKPDHKLSEIIITTAGSLLGMIPSGLVALSSTVFCISVIRISRYKTLAQDLYCVETLARVDTLCLDKTGTITEGSMQVMELIPNGIEIEEFKQILKNVQASINDDNATASAITEFTLDVQQNEKAISIVPFSSARKWSGATFEKASYVIGAAEFVFDSISKSQKAEIADYSEKGYRVLVLAKCSNLKDDKIVSPKFLGYILISDKIRKEAPETLKFFKEQGVDIKIISGDNPITVKAVALRAGLDSAANYIDLSTLHTDEEVADAANKYTVFGRVTPDQKLLLVKSLKKAKHTVAMTGDGVNDVLALKEADCSIAMASGSDAAKNVSSLVLLDSNFSSMPKIVAEGRRSINNLERSAALYIVKTIYSFLLAFLFMFIKTSLPFVPTDMTIIGAVSIGIPSFILALEPNKDIVRGRFILKVLSNALPGALTVVFGIMAIVVTGTIIDFKPDEMKVMYFILTSFASFMFLAKVCYPFDWIRTALFCGMIGLFMLVMFGRFPNLNLAEMFSAPQNVTWKMWKVILVIMALDVPIFVGLVLLLSRMRNPKIITKISFKIDGKIEDDYEEQANKADAKLNRRYNFLEKLKNFFKKFSLKKKSSNNEENEEINSNKNLKQESTSQEQNASSNVSFEGETQSQNDVEIKTKNNKLAKLFSKKIPKESSIDSEREI